MRRFIRHPSNIPIEFQVDSAIAGETRSLKDVSRGGLSFHSTKPLKEGTFLVIRIPLVKPDFEARGKVVWCRKNHKVYDIGLQFLAADDLFQARMIEQICHIEEYRNEVKRTEGRELSSEQAAFEWISRYASEFPNPDAPQPVEAEEDH